MSIKFEFEAPSTWSGREMKGENEIFHNFDDLRHNPLTVKWRQLVIGRYFRESQIGSSNIRSQKYIDKIEKSVEETENK